MKLEEFQGVLRNLAKAGVPVAVQVRSKRTPAIDFETLCTEIEMGENRAKFTLQGCDYALYAYYLNCRDRAYIKANKWLVFQTQLGENTVSVKMRTAKK